MSHGAVKEKEENKDTEKRDERAKGRSLESRIPGQEIWGKLKATTDAADEL